MAKSRPASRAGPAKPASLCSPCRHCRQIFSHASPHHVELKFLIELTASLERCPFSNKGGSKEIGRRRCSVSHLLDHRINHRWGLLVSRLGQHHSSGPHGSAPLSAGAHVIG